ncbi:TetR/AcrR family transcriptional regulator [Nocardia sp. NPDC051981]|uniref:TetR/AcrR family transcriptional regulator n=1 Tax=Nocardia sp. NPDC051981 TaxID=3155417 RepID=UPI00344A1A92
MVSGSATSRRQTPRGTLNRDRILAAAMDVVDARGLDGVTMRAVAETLDVNAMSLYRHFRDKETLLLAVLDRLLGQVELPSAELPPAEAVKEILRAHYRLLLRYPGLHLLNSGQVPIPAQLRIDEHLAAILLGCGVGAPRAMDLLAVFGRFVLGCALCHLELESMDSAQWVEAASQFAALPRQQYPALRQLGPLLAHRPAEDDIFEAGLALLVAPLEGLGGRA